MDNRELAKRLVEHLGGEENIASFTNCITRLRVTVKDQAKVDGDKIKALDDVLHFIHGQTMQIVLGPGKVNKVSMEIEDNTSINVDLDDSSVDNLAEDTRQMYKDKQTSPVQVMFRHIGNIFIPIIPGLVASGLILGIVNLITNLANPDAGVLSPGVLETDWFILLQAIGNLLFGSLGVFVGINTAREFKGTMVLGGIAGLLIYAPALDEVGSLNLFGLDLQISTGLGGLLGALIAAYIFTKIERFIRKRMLDSIDLIVTPLITLLLGSAVTLVIIQPIAGLLMKGITWFLVDIMLETGGILGGFILSSTFLPLVTVGLHHGLAPVHLDLIENFGSTTLLPVLAMAGAGQVGAAIAILVKTKNKRMKNTVLGALPVGILGVGEPLIYGVSLPLGRPFLTASLGAGFGGAFLSMFKIGAISVGPSGLVLVPLIADNKYLIYLVGLLIAYVGGFIFTYLFGFNDKMADKIFGGGTSEAIAEAEEEAEAERREVKENTVVSPLNGKVIPLEEVNDEVFSKKVMGDGLAIVPTEGKVYAPADGKLEIVFPTGHGIGLRTEGGAEVLIHLGLDTVDIKEKVFDLSVKQGDEVKEGDLLGSFNIERIELLGYDMTTPIVITNTPDFSQVEELASDEIKVGEPLLKMHK